MCDINVYYTVTYVKAGPGLNLGSLMIAHDTRCEARMRGAVSPHRPGKSYFARNRIGLTNIKLNGSPGGADRAPSRRHDYRDMRSRGWGGRVCVHVGCVGQRDWHIGDHAIAQGDALRHAHSIVLPSFPKNSAYVDGGVFDF